MDDEPLALARLEGAFGAITGAQIVGQAGDGISAARAITKLKPDIVMLDIEMPGMTGLELARTLEGDDRPEIVFVTAFDRHAPEAFAVEATDFLLKPVQFDRLRDAIARARRRRELLANASRADNREAPPEPAPMPPSADTAGYDESLWVPTRTGSMLVSVADIEWIEAARDYVLLHTETHSHILRATMSSLAARLDPKVMLRVHRSAFVRIDCVGQIRRRGNGRQALVLKSGAEVQIGSIYVRPVQDALNL